MKGKAYLDLSKFPPSMLKVVSLPILAFRLIGISFRESDK